MASHPACDRHPNLQMVPCSTNGYVCPVPGCLRHCDADGYFDVGVKTVAVAGKLSRQALARQATVATVDPAN